MHSLYKILILALFLLYSCDVKTQKKENMSNDINHKYTNKLVLETSPYLLQHAHNPVEWYPWGQEALDKAKSENKLIIVSIGYSACHWCHVMEHESFEDETVAEFMNNNFVCIKVDREERPDIDQVYMDAVRIITGSGGWPLNCIALPDGRPIYGGTYFPKDRWVDMLGQVKKYADENPDATEERANSITNGVNSTEKIYINNEKIEYSESDLDTIFSNWKRSIDYKNGGGNGSPKFPLPVGYQYLLYYNFITGNEDALRAVTITLDKMADGGIYDQVGGGFARYSVDDRWFAPHFEKMLYDNSQLVSLYSTVYQKTKNPRYKQIIEETLEFVNRELTSHDGGFYSALDADSEGVEGKFYVFTKFELKEILGEKADFIIYYYNVTDSGNWENGENILYRHDTDKEVAKRLDLTTEEVFAKVEEAKSVLLKARGKRVRPGLDDKILTQWNALMLKAYVDAYKVLGDEEYLKSALKNANFIMKNMISEDGRLNRNYKNGKSNINAFMDDYAFTIDAFIALYQATFDEKWLKTAEYLTDYSILHFFDEESGMFYFTSDQDEALITRKTEISDNVIPSSNSQMAKNLFVLGQYLYNDNYIGKSKQMLNNVKKNALSSGVYYANWDILMAWFVSKPYEVSIVGKDYQAKRKEFEQNYLPNVFLSVGEDEGSLDILKDRLIDGKTTIYVCQDKMCKLPVTDVNDALKQIKQ